jgi:hypothetical protein
VTGLDYDNARWYDPVSGQFLSPDTVQGNAQGMDPYAYVEDNPETRTDLSGQCDVWCWLANAGAAVGVGLIVAGLFLSGTAAFVAMGAGFGILAGYIGSAFGAGGPGNLNGSEGQAALLSEFIGALGGAFTGFLGAPGIVTSAKVGAFFAGFWGILSAILSGGAGYAETHNSPPTPIPVAAPTPTPNAGPDEAYTNEGAIHLLQDSVALDEQTGSKAIYNSDIAPGLDYKDTHYAASMAQKNTLTKQLGWSSQTWNTWEYGLWQRWAFSTNNISANSWATYQGQAVSNVADQVRMGTQWGFA